MFVVFDNIITPELCLTYVDFMSKYYKRRCEEGANPYDFWDSRNVSLDINDELILHVKSFLERNLNVELTNFRAELQTWPINEYSPLHVHNEKGMEVTDYNSMLYLNDDFDGGEFYTEDITVRPKPGRLTFFDGKNVLHGVKPVKNCHRYTIIFWWTNTKFKESK
jgi:predicted 2-oxoglutarate/Fe(II)-dependent dioxygenase YbiX